MLGRMLQAIYFFFSVFKCCRRIPSSSLWKTAFEKNKFNVLQFFNEFLLIIRNRMASLMTPGMMLLVVPNYCLSCLEQDPVKNLKKWTFSIFFTFSFLALLKNLVFHLNVWFPSTRHYNYFYSKLLRICIQYVLYIT